MRDGDVQAILQALDEAAKATRESRWRDRRIALDRAIQIREQSK